MNEQDSVKWGVIALAAVGFVGIVLLAINYASSGDLEGPTWTVESISIDGSATAPASGTAMTAVFEDGTVSGTGGCNTYSGSYSVDGDAITFGPLVSTLIACEDPIGAQEQAYFAALARADGFDVDGGTLTLSEGDTALVSFTESSDG